MDETVEELLISCSRASRAIRLLTAEAKRRSTLLRLCGADYENALDKLEAMRALKWVSSDVADMPRVAQDGETKNCTPPNTSDTGNSRFTASVGNKISDATMSRRPLLRTRDDAAALFAASERSSNIAESLELILNQARNIRGVESVQSTVNHRSSRTGLGYIMSTPKRVQTACATASKHRPVQSLFGSGSSLLKDGTRSVAAREREPDRPRAKEATARTSIGSESAPPLQVSRSRHVPCRVSTGGPSSSRSDKTGSQASEGERGAKRTPTSASATVRRAHESTANVILNDMREEASRYTVARQCLLEREYGRHRDEVNRPLHVVQRMQPDEEALLRALVGNEACRVGAEANMGSRALATTRDPRFTAWCDLPRRQTQQNRTHIPVQCQGIADTDPRRSSGGYDTKPGSREGVEVIGTAGWTEVGRLQQSLMMLLDEIEGRREVALSEHRDGEGRPGGARGGRRASAGRNLYDQGLGSFEDWYCWKKVVHLTDRLRARICRMADNGRAAQPSLAKEILPLITNPSQILAGVNPLRAPPQDDASSWRRDWQSSAEGKAASGTACLALVHDLQAIAPPCFPLEDWWRHSGDLAAQGHTVETFGRYLWASSILAAEADVSKMIFPPLTQALSLARLQSRTALHAAVHRQSEERHECGRGRGEWQRLEHLRESVPHTAARKTKSKFCDEQGLEQKQEQDQGREELWAPPLAVLRVVDALFHDGGRPRMSFVRFNCS